MFKSRTGLRKSTRAEYFCTILPDYVAGTKKNSSLIFIPSRSMLLVSSTIFAIFLRTHLTRVDEGRKCGRPLAIKCKSRTVVGRRGEKSLPCDPGSELRQRGKEERKPNAIKWIQQKKQNKNNSQISKLVELT